jgi:hypothetical protein
MLWPNICLFYYRFGTSGCPVLISKANCIVCGIKSIE